MTKDELRQNLLKDAKAYVNDTAISAFTKWMQTAGLPEIKDFAAEYVHALSVHGENESGWAKFRDRVFLPVIINGALWLFESTLNRIIEETKVKANA